MIRSQKGSIFPLAVFLLVFVSASVYFLGGFVLDRINYGESRLAVTMAERQSENALVYGTWASNTKQDKGGHKCDNAWYATKDGGEVRITDMDGGIKKFGEYRVERFFTYAGSPNWKEAKLTGIARLYNDRISKTKPVVEKKTQMTANMVYVTNTSNADPCQADVLEIQKETWHNVTE